MKDTIKLETIGNGNNPNFWAYREIGTPEEEIQYWKVSYQKMTKKNQDLKLERDTALEQLDKMRSERDEAQDEWGKSSMDAAQLLSEKTKIMAERDQLQDILRKLLQIIPEPECHDFGHTKEERHAFLEECPVMARYDALIAQAKEAAK